MVIQEEVRGINSSPHSSKDYVGEKASVNGEVSSILNHNIIFLLSWYFRGGKIGRIG